MKEFESAGVNVVAVSVDPPETSKKLKADFGINFPLLSDVEMKVIKQYGLVHADGHQDGDTDISRPANLLLDGQGVIRWATFTDNFRVRPHPETLLTAARDLR